MYVMTKQAVNEGAVRKAFGGPRIAQERDQYSLIKKSQ